MPPRNYRATDIFCGTSVRQRSQRRAQSFGQHRKHAASHHCLCSDDGAD